MNDTAIAGAQFGGDDPAIFFEIRGNVQIDIFIGTGGSDGLLRNGDDGVGLADFPTIGEVGRNRHIFGVAFEFAGVDPSFDGGDFGIGEARIVRPFAEVRVGFPGRHFTGDDSLMNGGGPRAGVFVSEQRHGSDVVGMMAGHAVFVEDGGDVVSEGDGRRDGGGERCDGKKRKNGAGVNDLQRNAPG